MAKASKAGERICPKCKEAIKIDAQLCKHCGTEFSPDEVAAAVKAGRKQTKYAAIGCFGLVLLVGSCAVLVGGEDKPKAEVPDKPTASAKVDAISFYRSMMSKMSSCDAAGKQVAEASNSGDPVTVYQAANDMERTCLTTSSDVDEITVPTSVGKKANEALQKARDACSHAAVSRWSGAKAIKEALDSGGVGKLAAMKESAAAMSAAQLMCAVGLIGGTSEVGVTSAELGLDK